GQHWFADQSADRAARRGRGRSRVTAGLDPRRRVRPGRHPRRGRRLRERSPGRRRGLGDWPGRGRNGVDHGHRCRRPLRCLRSELRPPTRLSLRRRRDRGRGHRPAPRRRLRLFLRRPGRRRVRLPQRQRPARRGLRRDALRGRLVGPRHLGRWTPDLCRVAHRVGGPALLPTGRRAADPGRRSPLV
ncbi:MAG: hypothetical protein AVDCRST_MAG73-3470, partial [uncultured Thermomicrobiales bacterium]